jgi:hypothetical protein
MFRVQRKIAGISAKDMAYPLKSSPIPRSKGRILPIMKLDGVHHCRHNNCAPQ